MTCLSRSSRWAWQGAPCNGRPAGRGPLPAGLGRPLPVGPDVGLVEGLGLCAQAVLVAQTAAECHVLRRHQLAGLDQYVALSDEVQLPALAGVAAPPEHRRT